jgi:thymidine kinase
MNSIRKAPLTVIAGPMGAGKSLKLIWMLSQQQVRGRTYAIVKPKDDSRDGAFIKSRMFKDPIEAIFVEERGDMGRAVKGCQVLAIDEAQFLDRIFLDEIVELLDAGIAVIACGLDTDFMGKSFGIMPYLLAMADEPIRLKAVCAYCRQDNATRTQLIIESRGNHEPQRAYEERIKPVRDFIEGRTRALVGNLGMYEARCHQHHSLPDLPLRPSD